MPHSPNLLGGNVDLSDRGSPESRSDDSLSPFRKRQYCYKCEAVYCITEEKKDVIRSAVQFVVDQNYSEDNPKLLRYLVYRTIHDEFIDDGDPPLQEGDRPSVPDCARAYVQTLIGDNYLRPALARHMWLARINNEEYAQEQREKKAAGEKKKAEEESVSVARASTKKDASPTEDDDEEDVVAASEPDKVISPVKSTLLVAPMQTLVGLKVKSVGRRKQGRDNTEVDEENTVNRKFLIADSDEGPSGITVRIHNKKSQKKKPEKKKAKVAAPAKKTKKPPTEEKNAFPSTKVVPSRSSKRAVKRKKWEESSSDESYWEEKMRAKSRVEAATFKEAVIAAGKDSDGEDSFS